MNKNYFEIDFHFTDCTFTSFLACESYEIKNELFYLKDETGTIIGIVPMKTVQYIKINLVEKRG